MVERIDAPENPPFSSPPGPRTGRPGRGFLSLPGQAARNRPGLGGADWGLLALSFCLHALGLLISVHRWRILARAQGDDIPFGFLAKSYLIGKFFNTFLPTSFGGDVVRIWDGSKYSSSIVKSSAIVVVELMTGVIVLFFFALAASLGRLEMAGKVPFIGAALVLGTAGLASAAVFFLPLTGRWLRGGAPDGLLRKARDKALLFREAILSYRRRPRPFFRAMLWAVFLQLNVVVYFILIGISLTSPSRRSIISSSSPSFSSSRCFRSRSTAWPSGRGLMWRSLLITGCPHRPPCLTPSSTWPTVWSSGRRARSST